MIRFLTEPASVRRADKVERLDLLPHAPFSEITDVRSSRLRADITQSGIGESRLMQSPHLCLWPRGHRSWCKNSFIATTATYLRSSPHGFSYDLVRGACVALYTPPQFKNPWAKAESLRFLPKISLQRTLSRYKTALLSGTFISSATCDRSSAG